MKTPVKLVVLLGLVLLPIGAVADDDVSKQVWLDYHNYFYINPAWEYYGDLGYRVLATDASWMRFYVRPSMRWHHHKSPLELRFGLGAFYTYNDSTSNQFELRPFGGVLYKWPKIGPLTFASYLRLEDRYVWDTDDKSLSHSGRLRYKLSTKVPLTKTRDKEYFFVPLSAEIFWDAGDGPEEKFSDDLRLDAGIGYIFSWVWVAEFHFIVQRSRTTLGGDLETTDFIFRFQLKRLWTAHDYMSHSE
jgi:hypothetical protein